MLHDDEDDDILMFGAWWKLVDNDDIVEVQFPHKRHGSAGKESNHAKKQAMADFLEFVDINSQPNGLVAIVPNFFSFQSSLELRHLKWEKKSTRSNYSHLWSLNLTRHRERETNVS